MRRLGRALANAGFFLVCYAAIPLLAGQMIMGDYLPALAALLLVLLLAVLLSFLPGTVGGGRKKEEVATVRSMRGNDPDPDRALRNEALPEEERRAFPLRAFVALICMAGSGAGVFMLGEGQAALRLLLAVLISVMLPLSLRVVALDAGDTISMLSGVLLYGVAGIVCYVTKDETISRVIMLFGLAFLLTAALTLNQRSMIGGATVRVGVRPPAGMRRRNRVMLAVLALIGGIVLYFDRIRVATMTALRWVGGRIARVISWLMSLLPSGQSQTGGGGGGNDLDMLQELGPAQTGGFWLMMEKVAVVLAVVVIAVAAVYVVRKLARAIRRLLRMIAAYLKRFTASVSEGYSDEQESLFDWDETKKELGEGIRRRLGRMAKREPKWEEMDARQRIRHIVKSLYRKAPDRSGLRSLTVWEALRVVRTGRALPEELAAAYDEARYSSHEMSMEQAERLRKEAKV